MDPALELGPPHSGDDAFRAAARRQQSWFRAQILGIDFDRYGNQLHEADGRKLLNYYDGHGIRELKESRFPRYSTQRDSNLLRSEHMPFNLFGPLSGDLELAQRVAAQLPGVDSSSVNQVAMEYVPPRRAELLDDATAFDVYIEGVGSTGARLGIGIEVKFTEGPYQLGKREARKLEDPGSPYWQVGEASRAFVNARDPGLGSDALRQVWRNHLLGLAMVRAGRLDDFVSITVAPKDNPHCLAAVREYRSLLSGLGKSQVYGVALEEYLRMLPREERLEKWVEYLESRYLVNGADGGAKKRPITVAGRRLFDMDDPVAVKLDRTRSPLAMTGFLRGRGSPG